MIYIQLCKMIFSFIFFINIIILGYHRFRNILSRNANNITFLSKPFKIALDAMLNLQCVVVFNVRKRSYLFSLRDSMWNFVWMTLLKFAYASPSWQCLDHVGHIQYFVFMQVILRLFYYYESGYQNVLT